MCGIIGYIGHRSVASILLKGLLNLEYRGYDSAGMAVLNYGDIRCKKSAGKIKEISKKLGFLDLEGCTGIAHTRWATHGEVSDKNAHPHLDCTKTVAIVHNGIIENYKELRRKLSAHSFESETDSEIIAHLIEEGLKAGLSFKRAFIDAISEIEGSYAVLAIKSGENKIIAARKGSPLVAGISEHGTFLASDIPSFLEWTKKVIYLHDYDVIVAEKDRISIYNLEGGEVSRPIDVVEWDAEQIKKRGFEHYMLKEIIEQTETIQRAINQDRDVVYKIVDEMRSAYGIFFTGCGSSYHACLAGSYLFSKIAKMHINVVLASEFENYEHFLTENTLVFALSQSGETADVLEAVRAARRKGSRIISIVNRIGSSLTRESDRFLLMNAGPEICVLSTKTYTSQVALMALLAYAGRYEDGVSRMKGLYMDVFNLTSRAMREHLKRLAEMLVNEEHIYLIGRELQYATALEAALKIKEVSYIHAEAFAGGELKHGPLALIEEGTPVIVFVASDNERKILSNANEVKVRGGYVIGVSAERHDIFDYWIKVPECGDLNPIVQIIPMQILSYKLAVLRGLDPDKPRNLAKSVTVI
ncbi:MAG: glutamine--fructose-6-phosphate transaminase (isomerizing) [Candidatus Syntropharchaeia archaeon]